jgi:predicted MPP superfamily phosphohydrolase
MKKIIHLSDIHVGHEDCGARFLKIIENISKQKQPAQDYIIVITGDIVENAIHTVQTSEAINSIAILKEHGYTVLLVPGNHDYGTGSMAEKKFVPLFKEKYFGTPEISYPKLDIIDDMAFIGLDSNADEMHWYDRFLSEGELGKAQLRRLKKMLKEPELAALKKIIYLHHHPIDFKFWMQLKDKLRFKKIIEKKVDVLLFGHYHNNFDIASKNFNGTWGIPRCYNAGSSTHKNGNTGSHRIIDLSNNDAGSDYDGHFI